MSLGLLAAHFLKSCPRYLEDCAELKSRTPRCRCSRRSEANLPSRSGDVEKAQHWDSRRHFFAAAAEAMRKILLENARKKGLVNPIFRLPYPQSVILYLRPRRDILRSLNGYRL